MSKARDRYNIFDKSIPEENREYYYQDLIITLTKQNLELEQQVEDIKEYVQHEIDTVRVDFQMKPSIGSGMIAAYKNILDFLTKEEREG